METDSKPAKNNDIMTCSLSWQWILLVMANNVDFDRLVGNENNLDKPPKMNKTSFARRHNIIRLTPFCCRVEFLSCRWTDQSMDTADKSDAASANFNGGVVAINCTLVPFSW